MLHDTVFEDIYSHMEDSLESFNEIVVSELEGGGGFYIQGNTVTLDI